MNNLRNSQREPLYLNPVQSQTLGATHSPVVKVSEGDKAAPCTSILTFRITNR